MSDLPPKKTKAPQRKRATTKPAPSTITAYIGIYRPVGGHWTFNNPCWNEQTATSRVMGKPEATIASVELPI